MRVREQDQIGSSDFRQVDGRLSQRFKPRVKGPILIPIRVLNTGSVRMVKPSTLIKTTVADPSCLQNLLCDPETFPRSVSPRW
jgi:hypothetical protein